MISLINFWKNNYIKQGPSLYILDEKKLAKQYCCVVLLVVVVTQPQKPEKNTTTKGFLFPILATISFLCTFLKMI